MMRRILRLWLRLQSTGTCSTNGIELRNAIFSLRLDPRRVAGPQNLDPLEEAWIDKWVM